MTRCTDRHYFTAPLFLSAGRLVVDPADPARGRVASWCGTPGPAWVQVYPGAVVGYAAAPAGGVVLVARPTPGGGG